MARQTKKVTTIFNNRISFGLSILIIFMAMIAAIVFGIRNQTYTQSSAQSTATGSYVCAKTIAPGTNIATALSSTSGVLCLKGGTYNVGKLTLSKAGAVIVAVTGERPIISGQVVISGATITLDGINVTWNTSLTAADHLVKIQANGVVLKNGEIWGAHSFAGLLITNGASGWLVQNMYIHDTYKSNSTNQDHLVYVNNASNGTIERCLFVTSTNGRGIKLGPPSAGSGGPSTIYIRYNTFYNNTGPSNIQLSYGTKNVQIYRNILQKSSEGNITGYNLTGTGNKAYDNIGWESLGVLSGGGIQDAGGNLFTNPGLDLSGSYSSTNLSINANYGRYAGVVVLPTR